MNELMERRRALMGGISAGARNPIYQIRNTAVASGESISTGVRAFAADLAVTILLDFTADTNPTGSTSKGSIHKLLQMGSTRELCIGKYNRTDETLSLWWMPASNSDKTALTGVPSAAGRKRFAITHAANANELQLKAKVNDGDVSSVTKTKTFAASDAILSAGYYSDPPPEVNTAGLPTGTINRLAIYDTVLSDAEIDAFLA